MEAFVASPDVKLNGMGFPLSFHFPRGRWQRRGSARARSAGPRSWCEGPVLAAMAARAGGGGEGVSASAPVAFAAFPSAIAATFDGGGAMGGRARIRAEGARARPVRGPRSPPRDRAARAERAVGGKTRDTTARASQGAVSGAAPEGSAPTPRRGCTCCGERQAKDSARRERRHG